jgi:hypothetical protein
MARSTTVNPTFKVDTTSYRAVANEGSEPIIARRNPGKGGIWIACASDETKKVLDQLEAAIAAFRDKGTPPRRSDQHGQAALMVACSLLPSATGYARAMTIFIATATDSSSIACNSISSVTAFYTHV